MGGEWVVLLGVEGWKVKKRGEGVGMWEGMMNRRGNGRGGIMGWRKKWLRGG